MTRGALRDAIADLLATGRAVSTTELRTRLAAQFPGLHHEQVYRQLAALARAGRVHRIRPPTPTRSAFWSLQPQGAPTMPADITPPA